VFSFFGKKKSHGAPLLKPKVDLHSHLLPGIDDGVQTLEESLEIIKKFESQGYEKIITTPHVMGDFYKNTSSIIKESLEELREYIKGESKIKVEAAAEYYLDESFLEILSGKDEVLTLGGKFVLFETSFMAEPVYLKEAIFKMQSLGIKPVLAHPERYIYLHEDQELMTDLFDRGVYFQININSLIGYYSKPVQKMAQKMVKDGMFHFLASDCHNLTHLEVTFEGIKSKAFQQAMQQNVLNDSLLEL
jgi:tyrosine-protein phosphatase YwqE